MPSNHFYRGSFIEADITPIMPESCSIILQGMPDGILTDSVLNKLMIHFLFLEDKLSSKLLFITADIFGFGPEIIAHVIKSAVLYGIPEENIFLNASHTHYAPGTISYSNGLGQCSFDFITYINRVITHYLPILIANATDCDLFFGETDANIGLNRRLKKGNKIIFAPNKEGYYNTHTPYILVNFKKISKKLVLVNHGCHPTGLGEEKKVSSDYPGYMRDHLKKSKLVDYAMFFQGAGANIKEASQSSNGIAFCENPLDVMRNGVHIADQIIKQLKSNTFQAINSAFKTWKKNVLLPLEPLPPRASLESMQNDPNKSTIARIWASKVLKKYPNGIYPTNYSMAIHFLAIGPKVCFVALPGEPVAEFARDFRKLIYPSVLFLLGYTNGLIGYIPNDEIINEGGYEVFASQFIYQHPSGFDIGVEKIIKNAIIGFMADVLK